jgi:hypothetical protein
MIKNTKEKTDVESAAEESENIVNEKSSSMDK